MVLNMEDEQFKKRLLRRYPEYEKDEDEGDEGDGKVEGSVKGSVKVPVVDTGWGSDLEPVEWGSDSEPVEWKPIDEEPIELG